MSIKSTIAAVAASPFLLAGAAFAGPYVNVESNLSYPDGEYSAATTDVHIGYEGTVGATGNIAYYVQGGPSLVHSEVADDTETEISGKIGASVPVTDDLAAYAESLVLLLAKTAMATPSVTGVLKSVLSSHSK